MRLEFDEHGYVCCVLYGCSTGSCVEYEGLIPNEPEEYASIDDWAERAKVQAYHLDSNGNLAYDAKRAESLPDEHYERDGWNPGDTFTLPFAAYLGGVITASTKDCVITIPLGCRIRATSVTATGRVILRGVMGYLDNMPSETGIPLEGEAYSSTAIVLNAKAGLVKLTVAKNEAFTNVINNTPVMIGSALNSPLVLTFQ